MVLISSTQLLIALVVAIVCLFAGTKIFDFDTTVEDHRKGAGLIAGVCRRYGLTAFAEFFTDYSVGDLSGEVNCIVSLAEDLQDGGEQAMVDMLEEVYERVLEVNLLDPKERAYLLSRIDATKPLASTSPSNSPISPAPSLQVAA